MYTYKQAHTYTHTRAPTHKHTHFICMYELSLYTKIPVITHARSLTKLGKKKRRQGNVATHRNKKEMIRACVPVEPGDLGGSVQIFL
jgi:hypothetical protein